ncbi:ABC transporter substrate-binding protein [Pseudomonas citronellolis]|uniref:ABC transporter substrate-binding protein n=1 Tax=Pseudomonas citronellolis TaxID=53408 RepID=UPI0023E3D14A|nr:ABC transporter substrate-binding protein [Pseudomonas citronellolis]MDF3932415.1 ABC transporter substrate-binding protein [Pseudomonas citronellolis]
MISRKYALQPLLLLLGLGLGSAQAQDSMVVVGYGGAGQKAQDAAFFQPFAKASGAKLTQAEYNGEMARIKVMVDTGHADWDVVQIEGPDLARNCDLGMFEPLDWNAVGGADQLIPNAAKACGSAALVWGVAIAYDADRLKTAPAGWNDFWDLQKFPGKRGLRKRAEYNLEFALLADGVAPADVYKVLSTKQGVDRAFAKLSQIKPSIQWWEAGAQPPQWLAAGDVVMTTSYTGRIADAHKSGRNLELVWPGSLYGMDYWAIIKGSQHVDLAKRFIAFANQADAQVDYVRNIPYGPTNKQAAERLPQDIGHWVPTSPANLAVGLAMNDEFWADHGEELEERFNAWAAQ